MERTKMDRLQKSKSNYEYQIKKGLDINPDLFLFLKRRNY